MQYYAIYWGVGGGYGGLQYSAIVSEKDMNSAETTAYDLSYEECESYGIEDDDEEDIESWLDYRVELYEGQKDRLLQYHYSNFTDNHEFDF